MRKQGDGYVIRSEESITLDDALPYPLITVTDPSHSFRMTLNVSLTTTANPLLLFRMTPNGNHMLRLFNSQLTADNFYLLTAFSTMSTDFSHNSGGHPAMSFTFTGKRKRNRHHQQCLLLSFCKFLTSWQRELLPGPSIHPAPISSLYFPPASCHFSLSSP